MYHVRPGVENFTVKEHFSSYSDANYTIAFHVVRIIGLNTTYLILDLDFSKNSIKERAMSRRGLRNLL